MQRLGFFLTVLAMSAAAQGLFAATQPNIAIVSGNGQVICGSCIANQDYVFAPLVVKVSDSAGHPFANAPVVWSVTSSPQFEPLTFSANGAAGLTNGIVNTDTNGVAQITPVMPRSQFSFGGGYFQGTITAAAGTGQVVFTLTDEAADSSIAVDISNVPFNQTIDCTGGIGPPSCRAGQTAPSFPVQVTSLNHPVPNVSVRLINVAPGTALDGTSGPSIAMPSAYCQTAAAADPYSVLTDANGVATCIPVMGPMPGQGTVYALIGSVPPSATVGLTPAITPFRSSPPIRINSTPVPVAALTPLGATTLSVTDGQSAILSVKVTDASGNPLPIEAVSWSISPAGAQVTLAGEGLSGIDGIVSNTVTPGATESGTVIIRAVSISNPSLSVVFTLTATPPMVVAGVIKVAGDGQSARVNTAFASPLVVQVYSTTGAGVPNIPVQFVVTGPATLSAVTATTDLKGQAQVAVTAGSTPGTAAVTATLAGSLPAVTFNLTVLPAGPILTASNFVNAADWQAGSLSPCSLAAVVGTGIVTTGTPPLLIGQNMLSGGSITLGASLAPLLWAGAAGNQQAIIFQVPCELTPGDTTTVVSANGGSTTLTITLKTASPAVFTTAMSDGKKRALLVRPDGSIVSLTNPARRGESVIALTTGLGAVSPSVATNALPIPAAGAPSIPTGAVVVAVNNAGVNGASAQLSPDMLGVFQVSFQIPPDAPQSNDVPFSLMVLPVGQSVPVFSAPTTIPIQ